MGCRLRCPFPPCGGRLGWGVALTDPNNSKFKQIAHRFRFNIYLFIATTVLLILALLGVI